MANTHEWEKSADAGDIHNLYEYIPEDLTPSKSFPGISKEEAEKLQAEAAVYSDMVHDTIPDLPSARSGDTIEYGVESDPNKKFIDALYKMKAYSSALTSLTTGGKLGKTNKEKYSQNFKYVESVLREQYPQLSRNEITELSIILSNKTAKTPKREFDMDLCHKIADEFLKAKEEKFRAAAMTTEYSAYQDDLPVVVGKVVEEPKFGERAVTPKDDKLRTLVGKTTNEEDQFELRDVSAEDKELPTVKGEVVVDENTPLIPYNPWAEYVNRPKYKMRDVKEEEKDVFSHPFFKNSSNYNELAEIAEAEETRKKKPFWSRMTNFVSNIFNKKKYTSFPEEFNEREHTMAPMERVYNLEESPYNTVIAERAAQSYLRSYPVVSKESAKESRTVESQAEPTTKKEEKSLALPDKNAQIHQELSQLIKDYKKSSSSANNYEAKASNYEGLDDSFFVDEADKAPMADFSKVKNSPLQVNKGFFDKLKFWKDR